MKVGDLLTPVTKRVTQEKIEKYAQASGDFNPLHLDEKFAQNTIFKGTIAHGLLSVAYISEMMTNWLGDNWLEGGELEVTFLLPVRPGDTVTAGGKVINCIKEGPLKKVVCEVYCMNQKGELVIKGTTSCLVK